jgi:hypothetical protein
MTSYETKAGRANERSAAKLVIIYSKSKIRNHFYMLWGLFAQPMVRLS